MMYNKKLYILDLNKENNNKIYIYIYIKFK